MFDIAWSEFLIVAVVALVVVGPRDLPALLRTVGKTVANLRRMAGEFHSQFNEAMREAELDDLKREVTGLKDQASKVVGRNPFQIARDELKGAMEDKPRPAPSALSGDAAKSDVAADVPSAFAPPPPIAAPAFSGADFAPTPEKGPGPQAPTKRTEKTNGAVKAKPAKPVAAKPVAAKPAAAKPVAAKPTTAKPAAIKPAAAKAAAAKPAVAKPEGGTARPKPPGAAA